jgi:hypothetical protein
MRLVVLLLGAVLNGCVGALAQQVKCSYQFTFNQVRSVTNQWVGVYFEVYESEVQEKIESLIFLSLRYQSQVEGIEQ